MKNRIEAYFKAGSAPAAGTSDPSRTVRARVVAEGGWAATLGSVRVVLEPGTVFAIDREIAEQLAWNNDLEILPEVEEGSPL
jgi:hypothetical protein